MGPASRRKRSAGSSRRSTARAMARATRRASASALPSRSARSRRTADRSAPPMSKAAACTSKSLYPALRNADRPLSLPGVQALSFICLRRRRGLGAARLLYRGSNLGRFLSRVVRGDGLDVGVGERLADLRHLLAGIGLALAIAPFVQRRVEVLRVQPGDESRSEEHTSELQSRLHLVCRLLLEKKK